MILIDFFDFYYEIFEISILLLKVVNWLKNGNFLSYKL